MNEQTELIEKDILTYLDQHERKELLRFITCGSVDDGKSTLIGRLLHDTKLIYEDQLAAIKRDSAKVGTTGKDNIDLALLVDGLQAEREQGITIDVAYRYFSTDKRKFIIADTPGHEQYTRNMATGGSTCDLAVILIDARHGVMTQTKRHSFIVALLGIRHVVVAINKMDLVDYSEDVYNRIHDDYAAFAAKLDIEDVTFIPISALKGDNVVEKSAFMPWYSGHTLLSHLETVYISSDRNFSDLRFPIQYVNRPNLNFRGFAGTLASGIIRKGDEIVAMPSGVKTRVKSIETFDGEVEEAFPPMAITVTTTTEIDISRGEMIAAPDNVPTVNRQFEAMIVWMSSDAMEPNRQYYFKQTTNVVSGVVSSIRYGVDVNTLETHDAEKLGLNHVGRCVVSLSRAIPFDSYRRNRGTGSFIVIDRVTNVTVGAGMILDVSGGSEKRAFWDVAASETLHRQVSEVTQENREERFRQKAVTILLTGLTGAGKSTTARALERRLFDAGYASTVLDGENLRLGISRDLGFTSPERSENLRRAAEIAHLMNDAGLICIGAFVAPERDVRNRARKAIGPDRFIEVFLDAPIQVCRQRDVTGIYSKADSGQITEFPGVSAEYQAPDKPDLHLKTAEVSVDECIDRIMNLLEKRGIIR